MTHRMENPITLQSDRSVLLHTDSPRFAEARDRLSGFAELIKSPEYIHTYRITPLSLWNAASCGVSVESVIGSLREFSRYPVPDIIITDIQDYMSRYGRIWLERGTSDEELLLRSMDPVLMLELSLLPKIQPFIMSYRDDVTFQIKPELRGHLKQALVHHGFPVEDRAGYRSGLPLELDLRNLTRAGLPFGLRYYQEQSVAGYWAGGSNLGGSGIICLPCGAGKTVVGMAAMTRVRQHTLILVTNITALRQWRDELLDKTTLTSDQIGEYSGVRKEFKPVTITTYQILTYRKSKSSDFIHMPLFNRMDWGLILYDEVHLLPAPVFRFTAEIQSRRRLGLTATLVREDGREEDVFSLIGPKKYDVPWKVLEEQGWIAQAICTEIQVPLPAHLRMEYAVAAPRDKYRVAATNPDKMIFVEHLCRLHQAENILIIGQYLDQLGEIAARFSIPVITGSTPYPERERLFEAFRTGVIRRLVVSKVANFAVDLPEANVAIQVSGTYGSRQEEAQRLGRILRPKKSGGMAYFYAIVTRETQDQDYSINRQLFLVEQGYKYRILTHEDALRLS